MQQQDANPAGNGHSAQRFNAVALISAALLAILFCVYAVVDRKNVIADGQRMTSQIAMQTALITEGTLLSTRQVLRAMLVLIKPPTLKEGPNPARLRSALLSLRAQSPHIMDLIILDRQGNVAHWTGSGTPPSVLDRSYFSAHIRPNAHGVHLSEPLLSKVEQGRWVFALSEAIRSDQGDLQHVVVAIVDMAALHEKLALPFSDPGTTQVLLGEDGTIYARNPDHAAHVGKKVARVQELARLSASAPTLTMVTISQLDQKERMLTFHHLREFPLVAAGSLLVDERLADWRERLAWLAAVWLVAALTIAIVSRRANAISRVQAEMATVDELTGVANRRSIMQAATALERTQQHAGALSLLMLDIDHFKSINDRFGHQIGDDVIRLVSGVLRSQIRTTDFLGRYGGEEFLILMPDTGLEGASQVAEKLRKAVAEKVTRPVTVTISIGVATTAENDISLDRTIGRADHALYRAKAAGRNRVEIAPDELPKLDT